jgi:arylsulfatase A-like enzyme
MFVLIAPNCPLTGEYEGATLIDIAPTLLELAGHPTPSTMQGKSLVAQMQKKSGDGGAGDDEESLIRDRLAGLGYI